MNWDSLPQGWKIRTLGTVIDIAKPGFAFGKRHNVERGTPQLRPYNITNDGNLDLSELKYVPDTLANLEEYILEEGDVVFNNTNSPELVGKSCVFPGGIRCVYSNHLTRLRPHPNQALPGYVQKFLHVLWSQGIFQTRCQQWVNQAAINTERLLAMAIPLPPLEEQRRIVEILEQADELRRKKKAALALIDRIIRSLFLDTFGDPATNPKGWEIRKLREVADVEPREKLPEAWNNQTQVGYIPMEAVEEETGRLMGVQIVNLVKARQGKTRFRAGDILFAKITPCVEHKKITLVDQLPSEIGFGSTAFYVIRSKSGAAVSAYLLHLLRSKHIIDQAVLSFTGRKRVPSSFLKTLSIPVPPLALQQRFAPLVSHFEEQKVPLGYSFVPYKFGPFSKEVYEDLEALEREMLVVRPKRGKNVERPETAIEQEAAEDVKQILETVPQDKKQSVDELMQRYGSMGFEQLLDYVYAKYPQFAVGRKQKRS